MSTAVVAAGAAAGAGAQPLAGASGQMTSSNSKPWWRNLLVWLRNMLRNLAVVYWLLVVYAICLTQAINTMVALNAQQEISSIAAQVSEGSGTNRDNDARASSAGKSSAKTQLITAMRLRDELRALKSSGNESATITDSGEILVGREALEKKFSALPPEIQKAAIEAEAGYKEVLFGAGLVDYTVKVDIDYVLMPMAMVTLIMSLWMGALGGAIHMTVEFLKKDEMKSGAWYFFRPFHGALLALAVFIIFQAGQIVLTNPEPGGNAKLNPYVIAFVAIVSGMLTDQAYRRIGLAGSHLLGAKADEKPRWARPDVVQEKRANRAAADLARYMPGTLVATCEAWLDGSKELSESEQAVLAAWLHAEPRDLFTDQPPASKEKPTTGTTDADTTDEGNASGVPDKAGAGGEKPVEHADGTVDPRKDQEKSEVQAPAAAEEPDDALPAPPATAAPPPEKRAA
jgi:hypothetical protein